MLFYVIGNVKYDCKLVLISFLKSIKSCNILFCKNVIIFTCDCSSYVQNNNIYF